MTDEEFDAYVQAAADELDHKQAGLSREYGLGGYADFELDQATGSLRFKDSDARVRIEAAITPIGTFAPSGGAWKWAWANESLLPALRDRSERLKELNELTGMNVFVKPVVQSDDAMAWEIVGIAVRHLGALGCYRVPAGPVQLFVAINSVERRTE
ncbi:MAG TPA: hypothetical protein VGN57_09920 [Pirellulaceae bacterium]|jgi:hypothetical protein|nr:hypothetical protein [Pirellulaceae bacterium]